MRSGSCASARSSGRARRPPFARFTCTARSGRRTAATSETSPPRPSPRRRCRSLSPSAAPSRLTAWAPHPPEPEDSSRGSPISSPAAGVTKTSPSGGRRASWPPSRILTGRAPRATGVSRCRPTMGAASCCSRCRAWHASACHRLADHVVKEKCKDEDERRLDRRREADEMITPEDPPAYLLGPPVDGGLGAQTRGVQDHRLAAGAGYELKDVVLRVEMEQDTQGEIDRVAGQRQDPQAGR